MFRWLINKQVKDDIADLEIKLRKALNRIDLLESNIKSVRSLKYREKYKKEEQEEKMAKKKNPTHNMIMNNPEVAQWITMLPPDEKEEIYTRMMSTEDGSSTDFEDDSDEDSSEDSE